MAEGVKVIKEFLKSPFRLNALYSIADIFHIEEGESHIISEKDLQRISNLKTAQTALAVFEMPKSSVPDEKVELSLALDSIRDPGNLGTIIRMCDWFGVEQLLCSLDTVDCFNPKVVQATMGSLTRVNVVYTDLKSYLSSTSSFKYGAFMDGENIHEASLKTKNAIIVLGNEANGISSEIKSELDAKISIPSYGVVKGAESLNVAMAGAILLSEFKRR